MQTHVFCFEILLVGSTLLVAYTLITVCCEAPQTIMDFAQSNINYYNYIICILNCYFWSTLLGTYHKSVAFVCHLSFYADHSDVANYYYIIYN